LVAFIVESCVLEWTNGNVSVILSGTSSKRSAALLPTNQLHRGAGCRSIEIRGGQCTDAITVTDRVPQAKPHFLMELFKLHGIQLISRADGSKPAFEPAEHGLEGDREVGGVPSVQSDGAPLQTRGMSYVVRRDALTLERQP
jgi:hypothetical protein